MSECTRSDERERAHPRAGRREASGVAIDVGPGPMSPGSVGLLLLLRSSLLLRLRPRRLSARARTPPHALVCPTRTARQLGQPGRQGTRDDQDRLQSLSVSLASLWSHVAGGESSSARAGMERSYAATASEDDRHGPRRLTPATPLVLWLPRSVRTPLVESPRRRPAAARRRRVQAFTPTHRRIRHVGPPPWATVSHTRGNNAHTDGRASAIRLVGER